MRTRFIDFVVTAVRQAVPVGGIFALGWQPSTAITIDWLERVAAHGDRGDDVLSASAAHVGFGDWAAARRPR